MTESIYFPRVALVGLGHMGLSAATRMLERGVKLIGVDADPATRARAAAVGVDCVDDVQGLSQSDLVLLFLPTPDVVRRVLTGEGALLAVLRRSAVVVDLSTVDPGFSREMHAAASAVGIGYLDAPILGRPRNAGSWTLPIGGDDVRFAAAAPTLEAIASTVKHVGRSGAGSALKLLNNLMVGAINAMTGEIFSACERVGIDRRLFAETVIDSGAASVSNLFRELAPKIVAADYSPTFTMDLMHKDTRLALEMMAVAGAPSIIGSAVQQVNDIARALGYGDRDLSVATLAFDRIAETRAPERVKSGGEGVTGHRGPGVGTSAPPSGI